MFIGIFDFIPWGNEGAEMRSGGKDEPVDIIFLDILYFFLLAKEWAGNFDLSNADDVGFPKEALGLCKSMDSMSRDLLCCLHYNLSLI